VILTLSILIRVIAMGWSIVLVLRIGDRRMAFLTAMLGLMATRQLLTLVSAVRAEGLGRLASLGDVNELPGLAVSILAAAAVVFLARIILERRSLSRRLDDTVIQSQKMQAVGQFAGGVAHDFNNMLTAITGNADLAKRKVDTDTRVYANLKAISEAADRAAHLTKQLLAFSRRDDIEVATIDAAKLVGELAPSLQNLVGESIKVDTSLSESPAPFEADRRQMEQVLINLAVNARDAMPRGGLFELSVRGDSKRDEVVISARDTGVGIESEVVSRIFEPFFTTKPTGAGTGLGLATCHAVVTRANGQLSVSSTPGKGTEFTLAFPRSTADASASAAPTSLPDAPGGSERILLVEDEALVRETTAMLLRDKGFEVIETEGGRAALALFENDGQPIDLVLTDMVMPNMSGTELCERLLQAAPETRFLLMSGYRGEHTTRTETGLVLPLLPKPFSQEELVRRIRGLLDEGN